MDNIDGSEEGVCHRTGVLPQYVLLSANGGVLVIARIGSWNKANAGRRKAPPMRLVFLAATLVLSL